jgi:hypothetical protein
MTGVTFPAWQEGRYVGLGEVLRALGISDIAGFQWRLKLEELAPHPGAEEFEQASEREGISTPELLRLADAGTQIIDGQLLGFSLLTDTSPTLVIRAVHSTWWDIESENSVLLANARGAHAEASKSTPTLRRRVDPAGAGVVCARVRAV